MAFRREAASEPLDRREQAFLANGKQAVMAALGQFLSGRPLDAPAANPAAWLVDYLFEPPHEDETVREYPVVGGGLRYVTPYRDRVAYLARKFVALSALDQQTVVAHREDGVYWRGEPMWQLAHIAQEHAVQAGMTTEQRRARAMGLLRGLRIGEARA